MDELFALPLVRVEMEYSQKLYLCTRKGKKRLCSDRYEQLVLDGASGTLTIRQQDKATGHEALQRYHQPSQVKWALNFLSWRGFPDGPALYYGDVLPDPLHQTEYAITVLDTAGNTRTRRGRFNRLELPPCYQEFIQCMESLRSGDLPVILDEKRSSLAPRRASDLKFCGVQFSACGESYTYLCRQEEIQEGDWVLVPVGKENRLNVGRVTRVQYRQPEKASFPLAHIKTIHGLCTQQALQQLQAQWESTADPGKVPPQSFLCHYCGIFGCNLYRCGQGGCLDVQDVLAGESDDMSRFAVPFDPETAQEICAECDWHMA